MRHHHMQVQLGHLPGWLQGVALAIASSNAVLDRYYQRES